MQNPDKPICMRTRILTSALAIAMLSSCSSIYRSGTTPDDLYFSPGQERAGTVSDNRYRSEGNDDDGYVDLSDRYLRMKASGGNRWSAFDDDFSYWNNPYWNNPYLFNRWSRPGFSWNMGMGSMWGDPFMMMGPGMSWMNPGMSWMNPGMAWMGPGMSYNPFWGGMGRPGFGWGSMWGNPFGAHYYGSPVVIINNPKVVSTNPRANGPRVYNLGSYGSSSNGYQGSAPVRGARSFGNTGGYVPTESNSRPRGGYNNYDNGGSRNSNPVRTFEPSSGGSTRSTIQSSGGGNSGGSGGSAPVRSFPRGGGQ